MGPKCWGEAIYANATSTATDHVETVRLSKHRFGRWLMHNLDLDLYASVAAIQCLLSVISRPRRVWVLWKSQIGGAQTGEMLLEGNLLA